MSNRITKTFAADGSTEEFVASAATFLIGADTATNFGGGSILIEASHDGVNWTTQDTITEETVRVTEEYAGGLRYKLTLSGSTSPDLFVSIVYK